MGQLTSHRRTVLLALGLVALAAVVAAPGAADQTERVDTSVSINDSAERLVYNFTDTGNTTINISLNGQSRVRNISVGNDSIINVSQNAQTSSGSKTFDLVISSERPGVSYQILSILKSYHQTVTPSLSYKSYNAGIVNASNVSILSYDKTVGGAQHYQDGLSGKQIILDIPAYKEIIIFTESIESNESASILSNIEYINETITTPDNETERLEVSFDDTNLGYNATIKIESANGTELVERKIRDRNDVVGYGLVNYDGVDEYQVTVTGTNVTENEVDPSHSVAWKVGRIKSDSPILAIGGDASQRAQLLGIGLLFVFLVMILRTRD